MLINDPKASPPSAFDEFDRLRKLLKVPGYCAGTLHTEREAFDMAVRAAAMGTAVRPDFAALESMRLSEMTPALREDARELWLRKQHQWFGMNDYEAGNHIKFLLDRLDALRPVASGAMGAGDLPTGDEVYAEVCRQRGTSNMFVSIEAVAHTLAAIRALRPAASGAAVLSANEARYLWLRHGDNDERVIQHGPVAPDYHWLPRNERLDAMIDAAMESDRTATHRPATTGEKGRKA